MQTPSNYPSLTHRPAVRETPVSSTSSLFAPSRKVRYEPPVSARKPMSGGVKLPSEPEDAYITGATRSLSRRLLALNLRQAS